VAKATLKPGPGRSRTAAGLGASAKGKQAPKLRAAGRRRRGGRTFLPGLRGVVLRREVIGIALVVFAAVTIPWLVPITTDLADLRDASSSLWARTYLPRVCARARPG
jgi:hypothetical protein